MESSRNENPKFITWLLPNSTSAMSTPTPPNPGTGSLGSPTGSHP